MPHLMDAMRKKNDCYIFICSSLLNGKLISAKISATSLREAEELFYQQFSATSKETYGPFINIKNKMVETKEITTLKFINNKPIKAIYNDWFVNAFLLSEPDKYAYLIFLKRIDDKKISSPKGTFTVPISDLKVIND